VTLCDERITALEAHLDGTLRYRWLVPGPTVVHDAPLYPPQVLLGVAPLAAVTSVVVRSPRIGDEPTTLELGVGYEVQSAPDAILRVWPSSSWSWWPQRRIVVTYTQPTLEPVPTDVALASIWTVAAWMVSSLPAGAFTGGASTTAAAASGIKRYTVGQELTVEFADSASTSSGGAAGGGAPAPLPDDAVALLAPYGYPTAGFPVFA
jgi:hypothetical protein